MHDTKGAFLLPLTHLLHSFMYTYVRSVLVTECKKLKSPAMNHREDPFYFKKRISVGAANCAFSYSEHRF
jgi:hypothetical protein